MRAQCIVALGSNIDPESNVPLALICLSDSFEVVDVSRFYQTDPAGPRGQPAFWNGVVLIETDLDRRAVVRALRRIEHMLGRRRTADRYAPRPIDLDILAWDGTFEDVPPYLATCLRDLQASAIGDVTTACCFVRVNRHAAAQAHQTSEGR